MSKLWVLKPTVRIWSRLLECQSGFIGKLFQHSSWVLFYEKLLKIRLQKFDIEFVHSKRVCFGLLLLLFRGEFSCAIYTQPSLKWIDS